MNAVQNQQSVAIFQPASQKLEASHVGDYKREINRLIQSGSRHIVIDLTRIRTLDSACIGLFMDFYRKNSHNATRLIFCGNERISQTFRLCRIDRFFPFYTSRDEALKQLAN